MIIWYISSCHLEHFFATRTIALVAGRLWTTYHRAIELLFFVPCSRGQKRNDARARKPGRSASRDEQKGHAKLDKKKSIDEDDAIRTHDPKD